MAIASQEQLDVLTALESGNVIVDSVAGSGKTTTILFIAQRFAAARILLLTYSARLKLETRQKAAAQGLENLKVHSYHSFAFEHISRTCFTDSAVRAALDAGAHMKPFPAYAIIILDECQDMTPLYYELVCRIVRRVAGGRVVVLGDKCQSIYQYKQSDARYITQAAEHFAFAGPRPWVPRNLTESYRITWPMAEFVNKVLYPAAPARIVSRKPGPNVRYVMCADDGDIYREFERTSRGYAPGEIFILAPSIKQNPQNPPNIVTALANGISKNHKGPNGRKTFIFCGSSDEDRLDEKVIRNKIVFASFHQAKGLERKLVFVMGLDNSYFGHFGQELPDDTCPNVWYVACTRASEQLVIIHGKNKPFAKFVNHEAVAEVCDFINPTYAWKTTRPRLKVKRTRCSVTDMLRTAADKFEEKRIYAMFADVAGHVRGDKIDIPTMVRRRIDREVYYENVPEITGTAIPMYFEHKIAGKIGHLKERMDEIHGEAARKGGMPGEYDEICKATDEKVRIAHVLRMATMMCAARSGLIFKLYQIKGYNWVAPGKMDECIARLGRHVVEKDAIFEYKCEAKIAIPHKFPKEYMRIFGSVDCYDKTPGIVWEFKFTQSALAVAHYLQLIMYAHMMGGPAGAAGAAGARYRLYNIYDDTMRELCAPPDAIRGVVEDIVRFYHEPCPAVSDEMFAAANRAIATPALMVKVYNAAMEVVAAYDVDLEQCSIGRDCPFLVYPAAAAPPPGHVAVKATPAAVAYMNEKNGAMLREFDTYWDTFFA